MAEKDTVFSGKLKHKGVFEFKEFYSFAYSWLNSQGYGVTEKSYSEEIAGDAKNITIEWEAKQKVSDYFRFTIAIKLMVIGMKAMEVVKDGKKIKTNSGSIEAEVKAVIVKDYESKWENNPFSKFMRGIYDFYVIKSRIDEYEGKLRSHAEDFVEQCKAFLALEAKR
jgi:hypothetical protein